MVLCEACEDCAWENSANANYSMHPLFLGYVFITAYEHMFACVYDGFMIVCHQAHLLDVNISFRYFLFWDLVKPEHFLFTPSPLVSQLSL